MSANCSGKRLVVTTRSETNASSTFLNEKLYGSSKPTHPTCKLEKKDSWRHTPCPCARLRACKPRQSLGSPTRSTLIDVHNCRCESRIQNAKFESGTGCMTFIRPSAKHASCAGARRLSQIRRKSCAFTIGRGAIARALGSRVIESQRQRESQGARDRRLDAVGLRHQVTHTRHSSNRDQLRRERPL